MNHEQGRQEVDFINVSQHITQCLIDVVVTPIVLMVIASIIATHVITAARVGESE